MSRSSPDSPRLRVLELYSGIGGMHWALKKSGVNYEVVMAVDINTTANMIYKHNFPSTSLQSFGLEKLTLAKLELLGIDTILMSPPCQPFTRVGKKGDCEDVRTKSFLHVLQLIREMKVKPKYVLVENVKGFEISQTHNMLIECLDDCGYIYQEFLLTPLQFGIPNSRLRYYLIATQKSAFDFLKQPQILTSLPKDGRSPLANDKFRTRHVNKVDNVNAQTGIKDLNVSAHQLPTKNNQCVHAHICTSESSSSNALSDSASQASRSSSSLSTSCCSAETVSENPCTELPCHTDQPEAKQEHGCATGICELKDAGRNMRYCEEDDDFINESSLSLSDFMEPAEFESLKDYLLLGRELKLFIVLDIVFPALKKSTCFTKRYGHYVEGAGSVIQMSSNIEDILAASELKSRAVNLKNRSEWGDAELNIIRRLQLRYFTPREVANLLCFPSEFDFPSGVSTIQKYRVLGNSLNVHVVAELIKLMTQGAES